MTVRTAKHTPWYHEPLPQCETETLSGDQCLFTARYEGVKHDVKMCKAHADIADFPVRPIRENKVTLR